MSYKINNKDGVYIEECDFYAEQEIYAQGNIFLANKKKLANDSSPSSAQVSMDSSNSIGEVRLLSNQSETISEIYGTVYYNVDVKTITGVGSGLRVDIEYAPLFPGGPIYRVRKITVPGSGYENDDELLVLGTDIGGSTPTDDVSLFVRAVSQPADLSARGIYFDLSIIGDETSLGLGTINTFNINSTYFWDAPIILKSKQTDLSRSTWFNMSPNNSAITSYRLRDPLSFIPGEMVGEISVSNSGIGLYSYQENYNAMTSTQEGLFSSQVLLNFDLLTLEAREENYGIGGVIAVSQIYLEPEKIWNRPLQYTFHELRGQDISGATSVTVGATSISQTIDISTDITSVNHIEFTATVFSSITGNAGVIKIEGAFKMDSTGPTLTQLGGTVSPFNQQDFIFPVPTVDFLIVGTTLSVVMTGVVGEQLAWKWSYSKTS